MTGIATAPVHAQAASVVSACSGVSLPRSVVTDIVRDPLLGIVNPIQSTVNNILGVVGVIPIVGQVFPPLNINVSGLLSTAASGAPISLSVLDNNGTIIGPSDQCNSIADSFQLNTQGGIAIGGNRITGLGSNGLDAVAGEAGSIAFGNSAVTAAAATNAVALGTGATVTAANGVALGAGSVADRAPSAAYAAYGLATPQASAGSVSVGAPGAERQITNVAPGSAPTDAVNVAQLAAVSTTAANAVQYDVDGGGNRLNSITLAGGAAGPVTITNVADGTVAAGSSDAVTGNQLFATNNQVATNTTNIATNTTNIGNILNGTAGLVLQAGGSPGGGAISVGAATGGTSLSVSGTDGNRLVSGVANGNVAAGSSDAVTGDQLFATNSQVATNTSAIATNTANIATNTANIASNSTAITTLAAGIDNGTRGLVQQAGGAPGAGMISVGAATGGTMINVAGTDGNRVISGVAAGVAATDAVNVSQLAGVAATAANGVQYDQDGGGNRLNIVTLAGGAAGPVTITNLADGTLAAGSRDAVTGSQLFATNTQVAANTSAIATNTANIATNTTNIASILNGTAGLVQQAGGSPGTGMISIGAATGGTMVSVAGTDGNRVVSGVAAGVAATDAVNVGQLASVAASAANAVQYDLDGGGNRLNSVTLAGGTAGPVTLTNVTDGTVAAGSSDAVTGNQLFATNSQVAANTSSIAANTTAISANTTNIAANTTAITQLADGIDNGTRGLVQQAGGAPGNGQISIGAATGGTVISVAGTDGNRVLSGLAAGVAGSDAVTVAQLNQLTGGNLNAVQYDDDGSGGRSNRVTLTGGSAGPVSITNLADGTIAAGSSDAVTGSQLAATNLVVSQTSTTVNAIVQGQAGAFRSDNTAGAAAPAATGANATTGGFGAVASAVQSVALGNGAISTGINSVAIGSGSSDGGEANVVSVGSSSQLRRLTNVGPAINGTDAINLSQLQSATTQFQGSINNLQGQIAGLQGQISNLSFDVRNVQRRANAGAAGAMALAGLPQAFVPGKGMIAAAIGEFEGEVAFAFGLSKVIGNQTVVRAGSTFTSRGPKGFNAGVGYQF
ncbi:YadA-like family protein [Sandarakinorhabdus oryzae]|uniref:YadA-like family protein n=1 Tax=Sandarakinorhabdus oryzae TaxID=2675220 RepID=UPI0018CC328D|nr:YadA-like family protein [Sandarakinorhabdus oryzae]